MQNLSGGAYLAKLLKQLGVNYVFGVPGGQLFPFMDAVSREEGMELLTTRHEENSGHMADAVTRLSGAPAVCFGTVGPGAANLFPGIAAAHADSIPMIVITPNNQTFCSYPHMGSIQDGNHLDVFKPVTKWNAVVNQRERLGEMLLTAYRQAYTGRPGPVHLDIPVDVMFKTAPDQELAVEHYMPSGRIKGDPQSISGAAGMICKAKRPVLVAGGGVVRSGAWEEFRRVAALGIPATTTPMGDGCVEVKDETYFGTSGWLGGAAVIKALSEADLIIAVGCRFSSWLGLGKPPILGTADTQKIIHVDIDPANIGMNAPAELGIVSDAKEFLQDLYLELEGSKMPVADWQKWSAELVAAYKEYMLSLTELAKQVSTPMNEATALQALAGALDKDAVVAFDGGQVMEWTHTFVHVDHPLKKMFPAGFGHLGFGLPFANAAKLIFPDKKVVNITGDGAFGLTCQELETAVRYKLPTVTIVFNDRAWGMIKGGQIGLYNNPVGVDFTDASYSDVAKGFGAYGERVQKPDQIGPALERAFASGKPAVIDVPVALTPHPVDRYWPELIMCGCEFPMPPGA